MPKPAGRGQCAFPTGVALPQPPAPLELPAMKCLLPPRRQPQLRRARPGDGIAAWGVLHRAVHEGAAAAYTPAQRHAWAPAAAPPGWEAGLLAGHTVLAQTRGRICGFMTLAGDGHLDYAYVLPEAMGTGLAHRLLDRLERQARADGLTLLTTEASLLARRFLLRRGWQVLARQDVIRDGIALPNYRMQHRLLPD